MKRYRFAAILWTCLIAALMLLGLFALCRAAAESPDTLSLVVTRTPLAATRPVQTSPVGPTGTAVRPAATSVPAAPATAQPKATANMQEWEWPKPGFSGWPAITVTQGIRHYVYYRWWPTCDAPARREIPMIVGKRNFDTDRALLAELFDGPCNDGRPLLFLNEPARVEQANVSPIEAAHIFYTMTRGADWPYARWRGPIYAGNNLVEDRQWDREFVRHFARLHNQGNLAIPEIAGWAIHLYGNYEYGPKAGDSNVVWTRDIPASATRAVVYRSMYQADRYLAERRAEGNSTLLLVTEFGLLQASTWHTPPTFYYTTTARFMDEYVRVFDRRREIEAWFSFISTSPKKELLDTNLMIDARGVLTPNGLKWRELAKARQPGGSGLALDR